ncbi:MAG: cyclopropane-fatty-acyl-phospholipid synthase family protein [Thermoguttaceae bacterium]|jgi:cyclopropane-fatty-acyl-phospholipid synthase
MSPRDLHYAERPTVAASAPAETRRRPATDQWPSSPAPRHAERGRPSGIERRLAQRLLRAISSPPLGLVLWNGEEISARSSRASRSEGDSPIFADAKIGTAPAPVARILFHNRAAFWKVLLDPDFQFGEAYADGQLEVEGDLVSLLEMIYRARSAARCSGGAVYSGLLGWLHRARANTPSAARQNIHHHYDIGEDFYRFWLDREMVYSGAYFADSAMTLEEAQLAKLDYVCRKLWLRPGETVVEIGGGWGALALLMARDYGVTVKSFNISRRQLDFARRRAKAEGLDSRVEFIEDDYRNIAGRFDALLSLGMLEHVGASHYREFGQACNRCLSPTGRGLIQTIGQNAAGPVNPWIQRRIFPGGYVPSLRQMADIFEPSDFSILDIENLRLHYAKTLRNWLDRFEAAADRVAAMFDRRFVRIWRLYLAGSCAAFATGELQLFQVVFARPGLNEIPQNRAVLYG